MFNANGLTKGLTFIKIVGGLSKTLQIANQIIPLYQKAKPAISNARGVLNILKEMNKPVTTKVNQTPQIKLQQKTTSKEKTPVAPTFFL